MVNEPISRVALKSSGVKHVPADFPWSTDNLSNVAARLVHYVLHDKAKLVVKMYKVFVHARRSLKSNYYFTIPSQE